MIVSPRSSSGASSAIVSPTRPPAPSSTRARGAVELGDEIGRRRRADRHPRRRSRRWRRRRRRRRRSCGRRAVSRRTMFAPMRPSPTIPSCMPEACHVTTRHGTPPANLVTFRAAGPIRSASCSMCSGSSTPTEPSSPTSTQWPVDRGPRPPPRASCRAATGAPAHPHRPQRREPAAPARGRQARPVGVPVPGRAAAARGDTPPGRVARGASWSTTSD